VNSIALISGVLLDRLLGEPKRWHPLVGFGYLANWLEYRFNAPKSSGAKLAGLACWLVLVFLTTGIFYVFLQLLPVEAVFIINCLVVYFVVGLKSLAEHGRNVLKPLIIADSAQARSQIAMMVSRDTQTLNEQQIAAATCESVLENGSDAVFAALFWFVLLGAPGAILYRFSNTLDAMWGYKTDRFYRFGWAAARIDDGLNWFPARLTALSYALSGNFSKGIQCSREQGSACESPNAGYVMAAGAGALNITLGGAASYHGKIQQRTLFGMGPKAVARDIERAIGLVQRSVVLWILALLLIEFFL
jgi:adenosylcobinamide-phosphate synthase